MTNTIQKIKTLITEGRTDEALNQLIDFCERNYPAHEVSVLQIKARFSALEQQIIDGTISDADKSIELAKITKALFSLLLLIKEDVSTTSVETTAEATEKPTPIAINWQWIGLVFGGIVVLTSIILLAKNYKSQPNNVVVEAPKKIPKTIFKGKVLHADLSAAVNVALEIDRKAAVTATDNNGNFTLEIPDSTMKKGNAGVVIYINNKRSKWSRNLDLNQAVFKELKIP